MILKKISWEPTLSRIFGVGFIGVLVFLGMFLLGGASLRAETMSWLATEKLRLGFIAPSDLIASWELNAGGDAEIGHWHSIVTIGENESVISRHLSFDGLQVERGDWKVTSGCSDAVFAGSALNGRLAVRQHLKADAEYRLRLAVKIENTSSDIIHLPDGIRLMIGPGLGEYPVEGFGIAEKMYSFVEPVVSSDKTIIRVDMENPTESQISSLTGVEWYGLHSRYFALLLAPSGSHADNPGHIGFQYPPSDNLKGLPERYLPMVWVDLGISRMNPAQFIQRDFLVFSGPKTTSTLSGEPGNFSGLLFSGLWKWMAALCMGLLWLLKAIHSVIPSWGLAIIVLAVLVRVAMYPFARRALLSQKAFADVQKIIQPEMRRIKREYKGGVQSEKILRLYERHGVNPLAGLKPLLIVLVQLPIFVALFHVLGRAFELMDAPFLWIETLSSPDRTFHMGLNLPYFGEYINVLPVLMAATTLLTIKMAPAPAADKSGGVGQNIFLIIVAISFFLLFYSFPSGMVLYWTMANVLHLLQQLIVERRGGGEQGL